MERSARPDLWSCGPHRQSCAARTGISPRWRSTSCSGTRSWLSGHRGKTSPGCLTGVRGISPRGRRGPSIHRVVAAINSGLNGRSRSPMTSRAVLFEQVTRIVLKEFGESVTLPSRAMFYRLLGTEDRGRFSFGSAKTRESLALAPDRAFGGRVAPGRAGADRLEQARRQTAPLTAAIKML